MKLNNIVMKHNDASTNDDNINLFKRWALLN